MNTAPLPKSVHPNTPSPSLWPMYFTLVGIGFICAVIIVTVFETTYPVIEENKKQALHDAILQILPKTHSIMTFERDANNHFVKSDSDTNKRAVIYASYDEHNQLLGFAIPAQGMGYQDTIQFLYGYQPQYHVAEQRIEGFVVLQSRETPGLGSKIGSDPRFLKNFSGLTVRLTEDQQSIAQPLILVKKGKKTKPWHIDAVTGATVSSQAVVKIMNQSLQTWGPLISQRMEDFSLAR
jgi:electron transport complex protein RnfG